MGVLETVARIVERGGAPERAVRVREMRAVFEVRTGAFAPEDPWFEARSRAFWCDAATRGRFGRDVESELPDGDRGWLSALERSHRGLFRSAADDLGSAAGASHLLVDVWSGAELVVSVVPDESRAELDASAGQLFDARVVVGFEPFLAALLPGAVFHPPDATSAIGPVLAAARERGLSTDDTLDALLRMERNLRSLSRVKAAYAYRPDGLSPRPPPAAPAMRRAPKSPT
jgi:hypothetical protein